MNLTVAGIFVFFIFFAVIEYLRLKKSSQSLALIAELKSEVGIGFDHLYKSFDRLSKQVQDMDRRLHRESSEIGKDLHHVLMDNHAHLLKRLAELSNSVSKEKIEELLQLQEESFDRRVQGLLQEKIDEARALRMMKTFSRDKEARYSYEGINE